jgi:hypothetical protein
LEGISLDRDKAKEVVDSLVGNNLLNEGFVNESEFTKFFQKGMFKSALIKLAKIFDE